MGVLCEQHWKAAYALSPAAQAAAAAKMRAARVDSVCRGMLLEWAPGVAVKALAGALAIQQLELMPRGTLRELVNEIWRLRGYTETR